MVSLLKNIAKKINKNVHVTQRYLTQTRKSQNVPIFQWAHYRPDKLEIKKKKQRNLFYLYYFAIKFCKKYTF